MSDTNETRSGQASDSPVCRGWVVHTPMGHDLFAMRCVGFTTTMRRGTEWAATGKVPLEIPENCPTPDMASQLRAGHCRANVFSMRPVS